MLTILTIFLKPRKYVEIRTRIKIIHKWN